MGSEAPTSVSIIICTRNRVEALERTLESVRQLSIPPNTEVELIVVDNGSTDGTAPMLEQLEIPALTVRVVQEATPGVARARNAGLQEASGEILMFTDDDTRLPENWISAMCDPILSGRTDAVAGCIALAPELERPWMKRPHRAVLASTDLLDLDDPQEMFGASMAFARRVLEKVPSFDEELGPGTPVGGMEDSLFSWQLKEAGFRLVACTDAVVEHRPDASRLSRSSFIAAAGQYARSLAYINYHWSHTRPRALEKIRNPWLNLAYHRTRLHLLRWKCRLTIGKPRSEGIPLWEFAALQHIERVRQYQRERGGVRNYDRRALVKRDRGRLDAERGLIADFKPLSPAAKLKLVLEILIEYGPTWRILRTQNVVDMVRAARVVSVTRSSGPPALEHRAALRLGRAVNRTLRLLPTDSRCLIQSLVLTRLLARRSIPSVLVIGVRHDPEFLAHAWVEHEGRPVLPAGPYQRLTEI